MTEAAKIHRFEQAGLGLAPFRFLGVESRTYQACPGAPVQPAGTCDYCGTGIRDCYKIESSDGHRFVVGSDCVLKTGDEGLRRVVSEQRAEANRKRADAKHAREFARFKVAQALLEERADIRDALAAEPHPQEWASKIGKTRLDWAIWMMQHAGMSGRLTVARVVEQLATSGGGAR